MIRPLIIFKLPDWSDVLLDILIRANDGRPLQNGKGPQITVLVIFLGLLGSLYRTSAHRFGVGAFLVRRETSRLAVVYCRLVAHHSAGLSSGRRLRSKSTKAREAESNDKNFTHCQFPCV